MGVASGCGEQEVGVASGSGWNLWVWLLGVVLRRYYIINCITIIYNILLYIGVIGVYTIQYNSNLMLIVIILLLTLGCCCI